MNSSTQPTAGGKLTLGMLAAVFLLVPFVVGSISVWLGKDINWDLKNYHYYNAYAFLTHRMGFDIAPAQEQTFINPVLDVPFYALTRLFPSWVAGFVLGFIHGFNLSLIFLLFWKISRYSRPGVKFLVGICVTVAAGIAPGFDSELGNTMNDNLVSLFVLGALLFLLNAAERVEDGNSRLGFLYLSTAGFIMGIGVGLKPPIAVFAIAALLALPVLKGPQRNGALGLIPYAISGMAGALISSGFWWWRLWSRYGNPFLPFYNDIFRSPYIATARFVDVVFVPHQLWEYFTWPILFSLDSSRVNQVKFFDIRFALLYLICLAWLIASLRRRSRPLARETTGQYRGIFETKSGNFLLLFGGLSFLQWMAQSSQYRYIIALELLAPLCFLLVLDRLVHSRKTLTTTAVGAWLLALAVYMPLSWGRANWSDPYFSVDNARFKASRPALVVMLGGAPMSYVIPEFPATYRFVRPESNFIHEDKYGFAMEIRNTLQAYDGAVYVLYNKKDTSVNLKKSLALLELHIRPDECFPLNVNIPDDLEMCPAS